MQSEIINQGLELMVYGMGTVLVFLAALVLATSCMSRFIGRYFPEPEPVAPVSKPANAPPSEDAQLWAVIGAAIHQHRRRQ